VEQWTKIDSTNGDKAEMETGWAGLDCSNEKRPEKYGNLFFKD